MNTAPKLHIEKLQALRSMTPYGSPECAALDYAIAALAPPSGEGVYKPSPNWCRTCGKHWRDPAAVFCSDSIHREATTPQSAPVDGDVCNVDGTWLWGKLMDWCRSRGSSPASYDSLFAIAEEAHKEQCGDKRLLRECYEWLFESCSDGPRVSEGALTNGSYTREFHALHDRLISAIGGAETVLATPPPASQERERVLEMFLGRIFSAQRKNEAGEYIGWKISGFGSLNEVVAEAREYLNCPLSPPSSAPPSYCPHCGQRDDGVLACCERFMEPPSSAAEDVTAGGTSTSDDEFPGMWSPSDLTGGATDAAEQAKPERLDEWAERVAKQFDAMGESYDANKLRRLAGGVTDEMVERLAKYIYLQEARKCSTLDAYLHHMKGWPRALPEARAMLVAALGAK